MFIERIVEKLRQYLFRFKEYKLAHRQRIRLVVFAALLLLFLFYQFLLRAPAQFPVDALVHIEKGLNLKEVSKNLQENSVIKSPRSFQLFITLLGKDESIMAGDYFFSEPTWLPRVAFRMVLGVFDLTPIRVTIPEGLSRKGMAIIFEKIIPTFDKEKFITETENDEGYLFPDTYLFFPNVATEEIISTMKLNFDKKIRPLGDDIKKSGKTIKEVIIMASILEKEAHTREDREIIAGVLWKRIQIGMPLQVDAPFVYYIGKGTYNLTTKDLKTDSPYNTYTRKGLPSGPIGNPGLDSILAAIYPKPSPYLYYLSDRDGNIYYSANFEKHKKNKVLYIN
ncbi:MAG: endolytic transglycosylase MltG [Patescibacteria group bacterium]